jgi:hypothetical protein
MADFFEKTRPCRRDGRCRNRHRESVEIMCVCFLENVTAARGDFTIRKLSRQDHRPKSSLLSSVTLLPMKAGTTHATMMRRDRLLLS